MRGVFGAIVLGTLLTGCSGFGAEPCPFNAWCENHISQEQIEARRVWVLNHPPAPPLVVVEAANWITIRKFHDCLDAKSVEECVQTFPKLN